MTKKAVNFDKTSVLITLAALLCGFYLLAPVLFPFAAAMIIAYLCDPMVDRLMRFNISRLLSVTIVFFTLLLGLVISLLILVPLIHKQVSLFSEQLPKIIAWVQNKAIPTVTHYFHIDLDSSFSLENVFKENWMKAGGAFSWAFQTTMHSGKALAEILLNCVLIPVLIFYLLRDWDLIVLRTQQLIPKKMYPTVKTVFHQCEDVLGAFFKGQLLVMLALCVFYSIALSLIGLKIGVLVGVIIGIVSIVPYLGLIVGLAIAGVAALVQFGTVASLIWVAVVFTVGHLMENMYLTPKLIGDKVGLHPVVVMFSILAAASLFGFFGILLALPATSVLMVILRYFRNHYSFDVPKTQ